MAHITSNFLNDIEYSDDTVTASTGKHVARIREIEGEARSAKILDLGARLEHLLAIEHFDLVGAGTASDDKVAGVLLELSLINHARLLRRQSLIPTNILNEFG